MSIVNRVVNSIASQYQKLVASRVAAYGLKYDDLLVEESDVQKALDRIDSTEQLERERRIKRAFDLSAKKKLLQSEYQPKDPMEAYLRGKVEIAKLEREEREIINGF